MALAWSPPVACEWLEKEEKIHVWKQQHSPMNVINTIYPVMKKWHWHKQHEKLPDVWNNLDTTPVKWHKYKPPQRSFLNFLHSGVRRSIKSSRTKLCSLEECIDLVAVARR